MWGQEENRILQKVLTVLLYVKTQQLDSVWLFLLTTLPKQTCWEREWYFMHVHVHTRRETVGDWKQRVIFNCRSHLFRQVENDHHLNKVTQSKIFSSAAITLFCGILLIHLKNFIQILLNWQFVIFFKLFFKIFFLISVTVEVTSLSLDSQVLHTTGLKTSQEECNGSFRIIDMLQFGICFVIWGYMENSCDLLCHSTKYKSEKTGYAMRYLLLS